MCPVPRPFPRCLCARDRTWRDLPPPNVPAVPSRDPHMALCPLPGRPELSRSPPGTLSAVQVSPWSQPGPPNVCQCSRCRRRIPRCPRGSMLGLSVTPAVLSVPSWHSQGPSQSPPGTPRSPSVTPVPPQSSLLLPCVPPAPLSPLLCPHSVPAPVPSSRSKKHIQGSFIGCQEHGVGGSVVSESSAGVPDPPGGSGSSSHPRVGPGWGGSGEPQGGGQRGQGPSGTAQATKCCRRCWSRSGVSSTRWAWPCPGAHGIVTRPHSAGPCACSCLACGDSAALRVSPGHPLLSWGSPRGHPGWDVVAVEGHGMLGWSRGSSPAHSLGNGGSLGIGVCQNRGSLEI